MTMPDNTNPSSEGEEHENIDPIEEAVQKFGRELEGIDVEAIAQLQSRSANKPQLVLTNPPDDILNLRVLLNAGRIPALYCRQGCLVVIENVNGSTAAGVHEVDRHVLRRLLASHVEVTKLVTKRLQGASFEVQVPAMPCQEVLDAVLSYRDWEGVKPLDGVCSTPVFGPKGKLVQKRGYDADTRLYYNPVLEIPEVGERPSDEEVSAARAFLLDKVLADFPWVSQTDRANYIGLLLSPLVHPYVRQALPLGAITATNQGSGKTLLAEIAGSAFGLQSHTWPESDSEFRKVVSSVFAGSTESVVLFDNVGENHAIDYPSFAKLLTSNTWADRRLGSTALISGVNDRLWFVTGNNITLGGDMRTRTVLVGLDPGVPDPSKRTGFSVGNMEVWLQSGENRVELIRALLVIAQRWFSDGAQRAEKHVMRSFTGWAQVVGGILSSIGVDGFLGDEARLTDADSENADMEDFLRVWYSVHGEAELKPKVLLDEWTAIGPSRQKWEGAIPGNPSGGRWTEDHVYKLGHFLKSHCGRFFGKYRLLRRTVHGSNSYRVERTE